MKNKIALIFGILVFSSGIVFADDTNEENILPVNDDVSSLNDFFNAFLFGMNNAMVDILFFSGIRFSLSFGYRF